MAARPPDGVSLKDVLIARIRAAGPMTLADYMAECLTHPRHGYYVTRDPFGAAGDFTTAPEISQMFGELLGLCLAQAWTDRGSPSSIQLVELGPGRGTLMADILRATRGVPGFHGALSLHMVEASPVLRDKQRETVDRPILHHDSLGDVPDDAPLYLVANEFFDALPIRQFCRDGPAWRERVVGLSEGTLVFGLSGPSRPEPLEPRLADTREGDVVETSAPSLAIVRDIARRVAARDGVALIVDYGDWRSLGDTFQAVSDHAPVDSLDAPGAADLTAHVDFEALSQAASTEGAAVTPMTPQGVFLERLGITARAQVLAAGMSGDAIDRHIAAHRRLTHPEEMGTLFKAMALYRPKTPVPPGFDP